MMVLDSFLFPIYWNESGRKVLFCKFFSNFKWKLLWWKMFFFGIETLRPLQKKSESLLKLGKNFYQFHNDQVYVQEYFFFCVIFLRTWKQISAPKWAISDVCFNQMFANCFHATSANFLTLLNVENFFEQILANLPWNANQIVSFLKMFVIWVFFEKTDEFFEKKFDFFLKSPKLSNLL